MNYVSLRKFSVLLLLGATVPLGGCFHDDDDDAPPVVVETPPAIAVISDPVITLDPAGFAPLTAKIDLESDVLTRAILAISDGTESRAVEFLSLRTNHSLPVLGLSPNTSYTVDITLIDGDGERLALDQALNLVTDPLPDDMPAIELLHSDPARMEPGYTLIDQFNRGRGVPGTRYLIIVDNTGDVVWYSTRGGSAVVHEPDGNLSYRAGTDAISIDLFGNETSRVTLEYDGTLHHDLFRSSRGTWLSLARNDVVVADYPTSEVDPNAPTADATVSDEPVIEFETDGTFVATWPLTEMIAPTRIGYFSLNTRGDGPYDWVHTNAVSEDTRDDTILISVRHQDAIVKFYRETGEIKWILGPHENWPGEFQQYLLTPVGDPFEWQYHQHAQMYTQNGTLIMYDNGNNRASPFEAREPLDDNMNYSRAVEFEIDEDAMTVQQVWEYGASAGESLFTRAQGDANELPLTGNVLITFGWVNYVDGVASADLGFGDRHPRIIEVTRDTPAERVFDLRMYLPNAMPDEGINVYRSERIPWLYPPDVAVEY